MPSSESSPKARSSATVGLLLICTFLFWPGAWEAGAELLQCPAPRTSEYRIAIHCSSRVLQLWRHAELIREYPIEAGLGGIGKRRSGDHKTPVGCYEVSWMASRICGKGHKIIEPRSWCKDNRFVNAATGPALEKLWSDPYGGEQATVISINYPNEAEMLKGYTGDCIHIHADRRLFNGALKKSFGCIHMFIPNAIELYNMVEVGTPVKILP
ncbi:MAG: L,D-transpeptidase [Desulfomonile tiedjei]|nr:L,D-transpeptidase [Desulfomonile tiedjei]